MTEMRKTFKTFEEVREYKSGLLKDRNNSCYQQAYDYDSKRYVLVWNHREESKEQRTLEAY